MPAEPISPPLLSGDAMLVMALLFCWAASLRGLLVRLRIYLITSFESAFRLKDAILSVEFLVLSDLLFPRLARYSATDWPNILAIVAALGAIVSVADPFAPATRVSLRGLPAKANPTVPPPPAAREVREQNVLTDALL
jgi:hypothetical protein